MRVYIAGPMTGLPECNYPAFHCAARILRNVGFAVENPAERPAPEPPTWLNWMRQAIPQMLTCDAVVLLPGWTTSRGANAELSLAHHLGMPVVTIAEALRLLPELSHCQAPPKPAPQPASSAAINPLQQELSP